MESGTADDYCGAKIATGGACRHPRGKCSQHPQPVVPAGAGLPSEVGPPPARSRDVRDVAWRAVEAVMDDPAARSMGGLASMLRLIHSTDDGDADAERALREVELRGRLMNGLPPRDAAQWALARDSFSEEALAEFARWEALGEGNGADGGDPLLGGQ